MNNFGGPIVSWLRTIWGETYIIPMVKIQVLQKCNIRNYIQSGEVQKGFYNYNTAHILVNKSMIDRQTDGWLRSPHKLAFEWHNMRAMTLWATGEYCLFKSVFLLSTESSSNLHTTDSLNGGLPSQRVQYIRGNMHTVFALLCFVVVIHWLIFPYPSGLLHWHCGNLTIAPVSAKQPWWIRINTSCEFIMNDCITKTKQSTTKPCAYFLGYTVGILESVFMS